jgi:hypothetical protein
MENRETIYGEFKEVVNMTPGELEKWLDTEESKSVGQDSGDGTAIGHKSGEKIVAIKSKSKGDLTDEDYEHMQKVISYVRRHTAQRPGGDITETRWHYSLKNWGHDATK